MSSEPTQPSVRRSLVFLFVSLILSGTSLSAQQVRVSPALPTIQDSIVLQASFACNPINPPTIEGQTITLTVTGPLRPCAAGLNTWSSFPLPPLPAGSYTVRWLVDGFELQTTTVFQVAPPNTILSLLSNRFQVITTFSDPFTGTKKGADAVQLSDESGYFWFFSDTNAEITVKILDGQVVNGRSWVFIGSMTTVGFTVLVTDLQTPKDCARLNGDTATCVRKLYTSPAGTNQNIFDLQTFTGTAP
ncbi:MAG: hypothetical protein JF614_14825 [Acidobacteria bacterium]|nr:hypothetical protein [Acidobacteriota bacterium]